MSIAAERELQRSIKQRQFPFAYYFYGESDFLKEGTIRDLVSAAVDPATRDFNFDQVHGAEVSAETLEVLLNTPPMMSEFRVTVVRDVHALRKDARHTLDRYLLHPSRDLVLVLVDQGDVEQDPLLTERATAVQFEALNPARLLKWVQHYAVTSLGVSIDADAAEMLIAVVGTDLPQLASELEKLSNFTAGAAVNRHAVGAVVGVRHGETVTDLLDAVAARDTARALELIPYVLQQPKTNAVQILMALSTQMLAIAWGHARRASGLPQHLLGGELYTLLRETRPFLGRSWGDAVKAWVPAIPNWDEASLSHALDAVFEAERSAKETRLSSEEQILSNVVLAMCDTTQKAAA